MKTMNERKRATIRQKVRRCNSNKIPITEWQYVALLADQNFSCAICGRHQDCFRFGLQVDHDHQSGDVRGLLCHNCNAMLGQCRDSIGVLEAGIAYLSREVCLPSMASELENEGC